MTSSQQALESPFGEKSTADDVLSGIDLGGTLAVVTGGYSGIGLAVTRALSASGADVVVPARRPGHAREQLAKVDNAEIAEMDLADLASVRRFAGRFNAGGRKIDFLINMGGTMAAPEARAGDGWESQFATNHLGHFALTSLLWPAVRKDARARVVTVSSRGHKFSPVRWGDLNFVESYDKWKAYGSSKTANVLMALQLDKLGRAQGVRSFSAYPGGVHTPLQRHLSKDEMVQLGWIDEDGNDVFPWKTPEQGAATILWGATSRQLDGKGGLYLEDCNVAAVDNGMSGGVNDWAIDGALAEKLWRLSADLTGVDAFA